MVFQKTLLDGLAFQHSRIDGMDMNDKVTTLNIYQQAFQDSSRIVSTMTQLFGSLGGPVH
jgi:flagellar hook-associated protein FlgK